MTAPGSTAPPAPSWRHGAERVSGAEAAVFAVLGASIVVVVLLVRFGDGALLHWLTSEEGILEQAAALLWALLAALVLVRGGFNRYGAALALVALLFCARELDLHKLIGATSFLKINFYRGSTVDLGQKLLGGAVALGVVGAVLWGLAINAAAFVRQRLYLRSWGRIVVLAGALLVLSKVLDRTPAILADEMGVPITQGFRYLVTLHEEWFECFIPAALAVAAWLRPRGAGRTDGA